jgi:hypothetical protein
VIVNYEKLMLGSFRLLLGNRHQPTEKNFADDKDSKHVGP